MRGWRMDSATGGGAGPGARHHAQDRWRAHIIDNRTVQRTEGHMEPTVRMQGELRRPARETGDFTLRGTGALGVKAWARLNVRPGEMVGARERRNEFKGAFSHALQGGAG